MKTTCRHSGKQCPSTGGKLRTFFDKPLSNMVGWERAACILIFPVGFVFALVGLIVLLAYISSL